MVSFHDAAAAAAKSLQSCPTLCDPIDGSPPGSPIPGILQARTLEWVTISFSNTWKWKVKVKSLSRVRPSATPWTAAFQAPPSMGFSRQEYWSGVPLPSPFMMLVATNYHRLYRGGDQNLPQEKEMQKGKTVVWEGLTNSWEKKRSKRQRRKWDISIWMQSSKE